MSSNSDKKRPATAQNDFGAKKKNWETVEIKLEELDEEEEQLPLDTSAVADVKPDVDELMNELQQDIQRQQRTTITTTNVTGAKRLFIFGDLTSATQFKKVPPTNSLFIAAPLSSAMTKSTAGTHSTAATTGSLPTTTISKFLDDAFAKDRFDLQESDIDEEGYSDIDFDDDDELVEDDEETDLYDPMWTDQPTAPRMVCEFETKQSDVGLDGRPKSEDPLFYFNMILGDRTEFFDRMAEGSHERAQELLLSASPGQTYLKKICSDEMQIFFGLCLQMSTMQLPHIADYWNEQAHYGFRGFGEKMSLNRFQMLLRVLNFSKVSQCEFIVSRADNKVAKETAEECRTRVDFRELNPLLDYFNQRMQEIYKCGQRLVLNEPLTFWKGKLYWAREMSEKFRCNAVSLHFLTEHTGLLLKIVPDVESIDRKQHVRNSKLLASQRADLAKELLKEKFGKGHTVYVSKYYGSYGLGCELAKRSTYCTGLLDSKRYGNCKQLIMTKLEKRLFATKYATPQTPSIMMGKWRRREKYVYFYSSDCLAIYDHETSQRNGDLRLKIIKELDWQLQQQSPTLRDQMVSYQIALERNEIKWDNQLGIYVFNLMVLNAYILYTMYAQFGRARIIDRMAMKLKSYAEFRQDIIASLLRTNEDTLCEQLKKPCGVLSNDEDDGNVNAQSERVLAAPSVSATYNRLLEIEHMPMVIPRRKGRVLRKKCRVCRKGGMLTFSKLCCEMCPGQPGLCETPCFKIWHDQLKKSVEANNK